MVSMIMSLMIMPLMIMSLMRMTMIIQFLPMNVFNTFYIITDFFMIMATFLSWLVIVFVILAMIVFVVVFMIMFMVMIMWTVLWSCFGFPSSIEDFLFTYPPYTTTLIWCLCIDWLYPYFYGNVLHIDYLLSIKYLRISFKSTYYHFDYDVLQDTLLHKVKP